MPTAHPTIRPVFDFLESGSVGDGSEVCEGWRTEVMTIVDMPAVPEETDVWRLVTGVVGPVSAAVGRSDSDEPPFEDDGESEDLDGELPEEEAGGVDDGFESPPPVPIANPVMEARLGTSDA